METNRHWTEWFERHGPALLLYARQWRGEGREAEDLVQEAFVRAWKHRDTVRDISGYLYQAVRAAAIDAARRTDRRERRETSAAPRAMQPLFTDGLMRDERRQRVENALKTLPLEQREVLVLKIWGELTFDQISGALGIPLNTAASRYRYALTALRTLLREELLHER